MNLEITNDDGLMQAYFAFSFNEDEVGENKDGFYSSQIIFSKAFQKAKGLMPVFDQVIVSSLPSINTFIVQTWGFSADDENFLLTILDEMCSFILRVDLTRSSFDETIEKWRVIKGYPTVRAFATYLKGEIQNKTIDIGYQYTNPFD